MWDMLKEQIPADDELTDAELQRIDQLYLDVQAGKVRVADLEDPDAETGKAVNNPRGGTPGISISRGPHGGTQSSGKQDRCYLRMKKMNLDDTTARRICKRALSGPVPEADKAAKGLSMWDTLKELLAPHKPTPAPTVEPETEWQAKAANGLTMTVHKQADGKYRWVIVSSSAFMDRDKEIVSQKALEDDTERMNTSKEFGTLDWWHTPARLGVCDFSAMHGLLSVESGTFDDNFIGEKLAEHTKELAASRSFRHPITEPDASGVYNRIHTFARALLPRGKEANVLTQVHVASKENSMDMLETKKQELVKLLGNDAAAEEKVNALLASAGDAEKAALDAGVKHKEETPPETKKEETKPEEKPAWFLADMKPDEFGKLIGDALSVGMAKALEPVMAEIKSLKEAQATTVKASGDAVLAQLAAVVQAQAQLGTRLGVLEGLTPRGYRPTEDPKTITQDAKLKESVPQADPYIKTFIETMVTGQPTPRP